MTREEIAEILRRQTLQLKHWKDKCLFRYLDDPDKLTDRDIFNPSSDKKVENPWYAGDLYAYARHLENVLELIYRSLLDETIEYDWNQVAGLEEFYISLEDKEILGLKESDIRFTEYEAATDMFYGKNWKEREEEMERIDRFRARLRAEKERVQNA